MQRVVFVEVLDRRGRPKSRYRFTSLPVSIGRAYTNDVIVDDRYISPEHLRIAVDEDGTYVATDLRSLNGLFAVGDAERKSTIKLTSGLKVKIGDTVLRFVDGDEPVPLAKSMAGRPTGVLGLLENRAVSIAAVALSMMLLILDGYLEWYEDPEWGDFLGPMVGIFIGFLLWAGIWSFANRLVTHRFDFLRHLAYVFVMMVAMVALQPVCEYVEFFSPSELLSAAFTHIAYGAWLMVLLAGHLAIIGSLVPRRRTAWSFGVAATLISVTVLLQYTYDDYFSGSISFSTPLKSYGAEWVPSQSMEDFLAESRRIKKEIDTLAEKQD